MSTHKDQSEVQEKACGALWNLAFNNAGIFTSPFVIFLRVLVYSFLISSSCVIYYAFIMPLSVAKSFVFIRSCSMAMISRHPISMLYVFVACVFVYRQPSQDRVAWWN